MEMQKKNTMAVFKSSTRSIRINTIQVKFELNKEKIQTWIKQVAKKHGKIATDITYTLCTDDYLLEINKQYLNHDYYTDIITFDLSSEEKLLEADIYISLDRVRENAKNYKITIKKELLRVMIHGILHLCGLKDKTEFDQRQMRQAEDEALYLYDKKYQVPRETY